MEAVKVRTPTLSLAYQGQELSTDVVGMVERFSYTDYAHGRADEVRVTLDDTRGYWTGAWTPEEGDTLSPSIICKDWHNPGDRQSLNCGVFKVTKIRPNGPPDKVEIIADSAKITKALRAEKRTDSFRHIRFQELCRKLAGRHGLTLFYEGNSPGMDYGHVEQDHESDLTFLERLSRENGFSLKLADEKLIVFEGKKYDQRAAVMVLERGKSPIKDWDINSTVRNVFSASIVDYLDPLTGEVNHYEFHPPDPPPVEQVLHVKQRVETEAQAAKLARGALRQKNKQRLNGSFNLSGIPNLSAGVNIQLRGFGTFDRVYFIESVTHTIQRDMGYETRIQVRHALTGY